MGNYATVSDVRSFKVAGATIPLGAYNDDDIEETLALVESEIELICNDIFYRCEKSLVADGNGCRNLFFQPLCPYRILDICEVSILSPNGDVFRELVEGVDYTSSPFYLSYVNGVWPHGISNIGIHAFWGWATTPPEIKRACLLYCVEKLMPGSSKCTPDNVAQIDWPDFKVLFKRPVGAENGFTGFDGIDKLLGMRMNAIDIFQVCPSEGRTFDTGSIRLL